MLDGRVEAWLVSGTPNFLAPWGGNLAIPQFRMRNVKRRRFGVVVQHHGHGAGPFTHSCPGPARGGVFHPHRKTMALSFVSGWRPAPNQYEPDLLIIPSAVAKVSTT